MSSEHPQRCNNNKTGVKQMLARIEVFQFQYRNLMIFLCSFHWFIHLAASRFDGLGADAVNGSIKCLFYPFHGQYTLQSPILKPTAFVIPTAAK